MHTLKKEKNNLLQNIDNYRETLEMSAHEIVSQYTSLIDQYVKDCNENIFINQLKIHYKEGDCLIVISASGNSPNVLKAVEWVRSKGGKIIGFLGFTGGELLSLCDVSIHIKTKPGEYGPVEDAHLIMNHILAHWFQNKLVK